MHQHGPSLLQGPITRDCPWWLDVEAEAAVSEAPTSAMPDLDSANLDPSNSPPIREDLVARVRQEIADGTYETPEKWEIALDRLLDRLERNE
jgi:anti-sigma28 factor (negative regulator of flagellin synthesis)